MVTSRQAGRWVRATAQGAAGGAGVPQAGATAQPGAGGLRGLWARLAWRRLAGAARRGDDVALAAVCGVAADAAHTRAPQARTLVADRWVATRDATLLPTVEATRALGSPPLPLLVTAALHGVLGSVWEPGDAACAAWLLADPHPGVRERAAQACRGAHGDLLAALWGAALAGAQGAVPTGRSGPWWRHPPVPVLLGNPRPAPATVLDALWRAWWEVPDVSVWGALSTWQVPAASEPARAGSLVALDPDVRRLAADPATRAALVVAAARVGHPVGDIARAKILQARDQGLVDDVCEAALSDAGLAAWCVERRLAPRDLTRRVVFFLLTGQLDQYRGMDPDGSQLSLAYAAADPATRTRMQAAMRATGGLDLVRVLVGGDRRARIERMDGPEVQYLAEQLAARGEWRDLWGVVQDVPLCHGVGLMRLFDGWAPGDEDSRRVFALLRGTDPHAFGEALRLMRASWPVASWQARIRFHGRVNDVSFAPDAPLLAVAGTSRVAGVVDLTQGRLVERYDGFGASVGRVLHLGAGAFVAAERTRGVEAPCRLLRCEEGRHQVLHQVSGSVTSLSAARGGSAVVAGTRAGHVLLGSPRPGEIREVSVAALGLDPVQDWPRSVATHPDSGRLAILGRALVLADEQARVVVATGFNRTVVARAVFTSPEALAVSDQLGAVRVLLRRGQRLDAVRSAQVAGLGGLAALPQREQVVVADRSGGLSFLDARTLGEAARIAPGQGGGERGPVNATSLHVSPRGDFLAVGFDAGFTDLYDLRIGEVPALTGRALVGMVPAQLGVIAAARSAPGLAAPVRTVLDLLHSALEHRFRFDIELGDVVSLSAGEYDISL